MTDIDAIPEPWPEVAAVAARLGLLLEVRPQPDGMTHALVSHPAAHPTDWSLAPTKIAFGRSPLIVASTAIAALREMAPRLQKKLDELDPAHEGLTIAAGVGSDGTVTALRVERDGTVRLAREDIERIAKRVAELMMPTGSAPASTPSWTCAFCETFVPEGSEHGCGSHGEGPWLKPAHSAT